MTSFASDNNATVHPEVLAAMGAVNRGHVRAYGDDAITAAAQVLFRRHFGEEARAHIVLNGTGANVLGLSASVRSHEAVICSDLAHVNVDECGAPEHFIGCKLLEVESVGGKISVGAARKRLRGIGDQHHVQPRVISVSQSTEMGTVYRPGELRALADFAHGNGMLLHVDGARICNAAAALDVSLRAITTDCGVDVLSFGGTKNGIMLGEAVVFLRAGLGEQFAYARKQGMQLASKMRFLAAQLSALLDGDLWLRNARHANAMAKLLEQRVKDIPGVHITQPVDANAVFATVPKESLAALQERFFFYVWNEVTSEARWMCSFDTTADDVEAFAQHIRKTLGAA